MNETAGADAHKSYHNRDVFIYKAFLDPDDLTVIGNPILIFKGIITSSSIIDNPGRSLLVKWMLTSHWGDFVQVNGRITSDAVHRALDNEGKPQPTVAKKEIYADEFKEIVWWKSNINQSIWIAYTALVGIIVKIVFF